MFSGILYYVKLRHAQRQYFIVLGRFSPDIDGIYSSDIPYKKRNKHNVTQTILSKLFCATVSFINHAVDNNDSLKLSIYFT